MKKLKNKQIFGILTALGFASVSVVGGVFAADGDRTMSVTETVMATVSPACGLYDLWESSDDNVAATAKNFSKTMINGELWNSEGDSTLGAKYIVVCNDSGGWRVTAVGSSDETDMNVMKVASGSTNIASGTATSGAIANWAFKIRDVSDGSGEGAVTTIADGYDEYAIVPTEQQTVVSNPKATDKAASFTTGYQVYIGTETPAGTYTGQVTYTLAHPAVGGGRDEDMEDGGETKNGEPEETKGGGEVKEEPKEESKGGNEESQGGSSEEGSPIGPLMTSVYNNTYSNVYNNYNTTGGTNEDDGGSLASNESGKTVSDAEKLKSGEEKALGVVAKTGGEGKKAEDDNTGWIVLGMTAAVVAAGAATGIYIYKTKEA